jgi:SAM-dependent methyltransferase
MSTKKAKMMSFWSERAKLYEGDARANTNDIWLREVEIAYVDRAIKAEAVKDILDFGCANGYSTIRLAKLNPEIRFVGCDINPDMIGVAEGYAETNPPANLSFRLVDILQEQAHEKFDLIYAIRVFQNMESLEMQKAVLDALVKRLNPGGRLLYIESYLDGYTRLNEDRIKMDLKPLPIHEHLTLLTDDFDNYVSSRLELLSRDYLSSSYYLITRLLYSYIAKVNDEQIDYNHPIHQVAALVPQIGEYGPQKASVYRNS